MCNCGKDKCNRWVIAGPVETSAFCGTEFQNIYTRPAKLTIDKVKAKACKTFSLVVDNFNGVDGVIVRKEGLYTVSVVSLLQTFTGPTGVICSVGATGPFTPAPFSGLLDVRLWIDDLIFTFPSSPYGQTTYVPSSNPLLFGNQNDQNPSVGFSTDLYLKKKQRVTFGFLFNSPTTYQNQQVFYKNTFQWSIKLSSCGVADEKSISINSHSVSKAAI
jgi:hypothetical protein